MPSTPEVIGKYKIERFLASGGMGDIYLARDPMLDRLVAIKLLREGFDSDELRERFEREARAAGRLSHPNIVTVYEFGLFEERPFIAMEYVPGESLAALIRRREPLPLIRKLELIEGLCAGLAHAHRANIVHRDIKPANLIVDPEGGVKVLDFGIVKLAGSGLTHHGVLVGTVNYMSPEQIAGTPDGVDHRSDVFAVGAVFYELLAYQRAFPGQMAEVLYKIVHTSPDPVSRLCPGLDPAIERAVHKCLDRSADRRYQDLTALRRDLARIRQRIDLETTSDAQAGSGETLVLHTPTPSQGGSAGVQPLTPDRISALLVSAQAALDARDVDRALVLCEQAAAIQPADTRVRDLQRAAQAAREAQRVEALLSEAAAHLEAQRLVEARVAIDLVLATQPDSVKALELKQRIDRVVAEEERRKEWTRKLGSAMNRARNELDRGALAEARAAIDEALGLDPENGGALTLRRRIDAAFAAEQERVRLEMEARARQRDERLGVAADALAADQLTAAWRAVEEAESFGTSEQAGALRGQIESRREALQRAAACVRDAQARLGRGDLDAASTLVDEALALAPKDAEAARVRGLVTQATEEKRARDARLRATVESARAALKKGQYDAALASLEQVRQVDPAWQGVAELHAEATKQRALELERKRREEEIARNLAQATEALARQDLEAARKGVEAVLRLEPSSAPALELKAQVDAAVEARRAEEARRRAEEERRRAEEARARRVAQIAQGRDALAAGRIDEAVALLKPLAKTAQDEPGFTELLRTAEAEHARVEAERRLARERAQKIASALERASIELSAGAFAAADAAVDEALSVDAAHADALAMGQRIATAIEQRVDELIQSASPHVAKERHQRAIDLLESAGFRHVRLDAEIHRIRKAAEALAFERRVDEALAAARGRFRRRSPEDILAALEQSGLQHPRIQQEMDAARQAIAESLRRAAEAAQAQQEREQRARDDKARAEQAREERAREERARADQAREEKARADKARAEKAAADKAAAARAAADKAAAQQATREMRALKTAAQPARGPLSTAAAEPPPWQRPAMVAGAAVLVLVLGYFVARQVWPTSPAPVVQNNQPAQSSPPASQPTGEPPPSTATTPPATSPETTPSPAPVDPNAATPPGTSTSSTQQQAEQEAARITRLLAQGDRDRAIDLASAANTRFAGEPAIRNAIASLVTAARKDAEQSRSNARQVNAPARDDAGYAAAEGTYRAALREGSSVAAARGFWEAEDLFGQSAARATTPVAQTPAPTVQEPPPSTQRETPRETEPAQPTQPAPTPPAVVQQQPPPVQREPERPRAPVFDAAGVKATLDAYAAAYANRSINDVVRTYPGLSAPQRESLAGTFDRASSYELVLGNCQIAPEGPTRAIATCNGGRRSIRFRSGAPLTQNVPVITFNLERRGGSWLISAVH